jgi:hypothetical protein
LHAANGKVQHPLRGPSFLIWVLGGRGEKSFFFFWVADVFLHVPKLFPKFSICSPRLFPIAGWEVGGEFGGEVFFVKLYLVWTVDFPCKFFWGGGWGFVFLSPNGKAQGALLIFLLSLGGRKDYFSLFPNVFPRCSL